MTRTNTNTNIANALRFERTISTTVAAQYDRMLDLPTGAVWGAICASAAWKLNGYNHELATSASPINFDADAREQHEVLARRAKSAQQYVCALRRWVRMRAA